MPKNWWFKFDWDDWLNDEDLSACSLEAQGLWLRCICLMYRSGTAELTGTIEQLRRKLGVLPEELTRCLSDLKTNNAADVMFCNDVVIILSRRRQRDLKAKESNRLAVVKHREKEDGKTDVRIQSKSKSKKEELRVATASPSAAPKPVDDDEDSASEPTPEPTGDIHRSHPVIVAIHAATGIYPPKEIWDDLIDHIGIDVDAVRMKQVFIKWRARGYNKTNYDWATDWYLNGIPDQGKGTQRSNYGTTNFRQQREQKAIDDHNVIAALRRTIDIADGKLPNPNDADRPRQLHSVGSDADDGGENGSGRDVGAAAARHHPGEPVTGML